MGKGGTEAGPSLGEAPPDRPRGRQRRNPEGRPVERRISESHRHCQLGQRVPAGPYQ